MDNLPNWLGRTLAVVMVFCLALIVILLVIWATVFIVDGILELIF